MTHTPGPWAARDCPNDSSPKHHIYVDPVDTPELERNGGYTIARLSGSDAFANARLVAAAPELLAALQALIGDGHDGLKFSERMKMARNAIAKATGK